MSFYRKLKHAIALNLVMIGWILMLLWLAGLPAAIVTAGAVGASTIAGGPLLNAWWRRAPRFLRLGVPIALSLLAAAGVYLMTSLQGALQPFEAALVTAAVLTQRLFHWQIDEDMTELRVRFLIGGLFGAFENLWGFLFTDASRSLRLAGIALLVGVVLISTFNVVAAVVAKNTDESLAKFKAIGAILFDRKSPAIPTILGLLLVIGAVYGVIIKADIDGLRWVMYLAMAGAGGLILKRTFSVAN